MRDKKTIEESIQLTANTIKTVMSDIKKQGDSVKADKYYSFDLLLACLLDDIDRLTKHEKG